MAASGILLMVDGQPTDLNDVSWCQVAPCGCVSGLTVGYSDHFGRKHVVATAEDAERQFHETDAERKKYQRLGFTYRPELLTRAHDLLAKCEHVPKYGYTIPSREGMVWAVGGYYGERTKVQHLVPTSDDWEDDSHVYADRTTLCGLSKRAWSTEWHVKDGRVECSRCLRKAAAS